MEDAEKTEIKQEEAPKKPNVLLHYWKQAAVVLRNKYVLTIVVFFIWLTFFDRYNLVDLMGNTNTIKEMKSEIKYYKAKVTQDSLKIIELTSNNENLEKYAREQYLMKKKDEEIFIVK